jgi:hypothetical protein
LGIRIGPGGGKDKLVGSSGVQQLKVAPTTSRSCQRGGR